MGLRYSGFTSPVVRDPDVALVLEMQQDLVEMVLSHNERRIRPASRRRGSSRRSTGRTPLRLVQQSWKARLCQLRRSSPGAPKLNFDLGEYLVPIF
jgi:hypothetical protein